MSGVCSNCTANTFGADCEICLPGYARLMPLTLLPCDQCADGYWDSASNGTCSRKFSPLDTLEVFIMLNSLGNMP